MTKKNDHNHNLINICESERPEIVKNIPQCYVDKRYWDDDDPQTASELSDAWFKRFVFNGKLKNDIMEF